MTGLVYIQDEQRAESLDAIVDCSLVIASTSKATWVARNLVLYLRSLSMYSMNSVATVSNRNLSVHRGVSVVRIRDG